MKLPCSATLTEIRVSLRSRADSATAARLARVRYEAGATDLLDVLDAEHTQLQAQDALADARARSIASAVAVYRALAGGWPNRSPQIAGVAGSDHPVSPPASVPVPGAAPSAIGR